MGTHTPETPKQTLTDEARRARNEYCKKWRKDNPERARAIATRYWNRRGERLKQEPAGDAEA